MWREQATPTTLKSMFGGTFGAHGLMAIVCASFLLSGCAIDLPIEPEPSVSIRPTEPPEMPDAAKGTDEDAAIAFAKHYIDVLAYAANTGDTDYLREISDPDCQGCNEYIELYEETYENGGFYRREAWRSTEISAIRLNNSFEIRGKFVDRGAIWRQKSGSPEHSSSEEQFELGVVVYMTPKPKVNQLFNLEYE